MSKSPDAFRTISEVADWLGVQAHVLRFWESKFNQVKPVKRAGGRRYYRPSDMQLLGGIKRLLHDDGMTIKGVQKTLREQGVGHVSGLSQALEDDSGPIIDQTIDSTATKIESEATVLKFRGARRGIGTDPEAIEEEDSKDAAAPAEPVQSPPAQDTAKAAPEEQPAHETSEATPAPVAPDAESETTAPVSAATPESPSTEPDPVQADAPQADAPQEPADAIASPGSPVLPSFMHRRSADIGGDMAAASDSPAETPEPAQPRARVVDAPDPPDESDLPYSPHALAHMAKIDRLSKRQARHITPAARELREWLDRAVGSG